MKDDKINRMLNALTQEAEQTENFDVSDFDPNDFDPNDFDDDDLDEDVFSVDRRKQKKAMLKSILLKKVRSNELAQVDVKVTRNGVGSGVSLPFAMFGMRERPTQYRNLFTAPAGTTYIGNLTNALTGDMAFTFDFGGATETATISCADYPYAQLVEASGFDMFRIRKIRYAISNENLLQQFTEKFEIRDRTIFGKDDKNSLSVSSSRNPENQQRGILDINKTFRISGEVSLINSIIATEGFSINLSLFIDKVKRRTAEGL